MDKESLIDFSTDFPIKVIGKLGSNFRDDVMAIIKSHANDFEPSSITTRHSKSNKYSSITCTVRATSQKQLDKIYQELSNSEKVLVAL